MYFTFHEEKNKEFLYVFHFTINNTFILYKMHTAELFDAITIYQYFIKYVM
jgi:hypothetical protein